ncbi:protein PLANT CADMIUM RESISTANCE 10-like [Salvia splendens]|uniref:protein PLANT CADMIUM RESISTANCE 10-like n=1 Tax=Salvia splendens TaxID=180675 RepID=UPI001100A32D|nr:protein PLANT CADMIUM RESISTANCE 10-like [Salvia splendens]
MVGQNAYVPPRYIPLEQSDAQADVVPPPSDVDPRPQHNSSVPGQWSSGICACFDDMQSCCVGLICPCYLFGRNAESLGSGTLIGSCMMHFVLWALVNTLCCVMTEGVMLGAPGCLVACYACGYRRTLRENYNLEEAPCGDFVTHFFCHLCAMCQEYREIRERSQDLNSSSRNMVELAAPPVQNMGPASPK